MENQFPTEDVQYVNHELRHPGLRLPTLRQVSILYSLSVILLMLLASRAQRREAYSGFLITELLLILPVPLILLAYNKYDIKRVLRLNKIGPLNLFLTFCLMVFAIPVVNVLNTWYLLLIKIIFGQVKVTSVPPATDAVGLLINILIIGGAAGICEEVMFRGTIMRGFERFGNWKAIFITAFLFGLWHIYFTSFFGTFLLGILIGFIVYRSNSIFGGMFAHFTNNSLSVLLAYGVQKLSSKSSALGNLKNTDVDKTFSDLLNQPTAQLIITFASQAFVILFFGAMFTGILIAFICTTSKRQEKMPKENLLGQSKNLVWLLPGFAFIGFVYVAMGLALLEIKVPAVIWIVKFIGLG